jgi:hypothetical protein
MSDIENVRKKLVTLLGEMSALRPFADAGNPDAAEFVEAFKIARSKARGAAAEYAKALQEQA